jgi:FkbM family methyltransferase
MVAVPARRFSVTTRASPRLRAARAVCAWLPPIVAQTVRDAVYPRALARAEACTFTAASVTGSPFSGSTADHVAYPFAVHGYFNWRNVAIARAVCRPGDVVYDVGANLGSETVAFSDVVGPRGRVIAFEPFPANVEQLRANAAATRSANVEVRPIALGDRESEIHFTPPASGNSGSGHVAGTGDDLAGALAVSCTTLDALRATGLPGARLIVIDAEGHEAAILRGAVQTLGGDRPVLAFEAVGDLLARAGSSVAELAALMAQLRYELSEIGRFGLAPIAGGGAIPDSSDWLAVPREQAALTAAVQRTLRRGALLPCVPGLNPLCGSRDGP